MTFYQTEILRLKQVLYANQSQIDLAISTRRHIDRHYDAEVSLAVLAQLQGVSRYHLLRVFKRYHGLTPRQYLMDRRIEQAKTHLRQGMSVTETCFAVGFASLGSFSALFKRKTGKAPAQFRQEQLSRSI